MVLGIEAEDEWAVVHEAYRRLIRAAHPDLAGPAGNRRAVRLNEAYAVLSQAHRSGAPDPPRSADRRQPSTPAASRDRRGSGAAGVHIGNGFDGAETLLLPASPEEAFMRLLEASHDVGEVSYVDGSCAIFEVIVSHEGETCSLLVTVEPHAHGAVAVCTLESLERVASPSARAFTYRLAAALGRR